MHKKVIISHWGGGYRGEGLNHGLFANRALLNHIFKIQNSFLNLTASADHKMEFRQRIMEQNAEQYADFLLSTLKEEENLCL